MDSQFSMHFFKNKNCFLSIARKCVRFQNTLADRFNAIPCCHIVTKQIDLLNNCNDLNCKSIKMLIGKMHRSHIYQNRSGADVRARDISQSQKPAPIAMQCLYSAEYPWTWSALHCILLQWSSWHQCCLSIDAHN